MPTDADEQRADNATFTIDTEYREGAVVLHLTGELDMLCAAALREAIAAGVQDRPPLLVIDLVEVTFLASSALEAIVIAHQTSIDATSVRVVATGRATTRPLAVTGLDSYLAVYPTLDDALTR